jgi:hypothetical protein
VLGGRNREPQLGQDNAIINQHLFEERCLLQEFGVLLGGAESPLRSFALSWLPQRNDSCAAWIEVLHKSLNGAALGGRVTALEQNHEPGTGAYAMFLQLQQFNLQAPFQLVVFVARHPVVVRISLAPGVDIIALPVKQNRIVIIVIIVVINGVPMLGRRKGFQVYLCHDPTL